MPTAGMLSSAANRAWWRGYVLVRSSAAGLVPPWSRRGQKLQLADGESTSRQQHFVLSDGCGSCRTLRCVFVTGYGTLAPVLCGSAGGSVQGPVEFRPRNRTDDQWSLVREESWRPKRPTESLSARTYSVRSRSGIFREILRFRKNATRSVGSTGRTKRRSPSAALDVHAVRRSTTRRGAFATIETKRCSGATGVPRETITKEVLPPCAAARRCVDDGGVYRERRPQRHVNTHCSNLLVATRPLNSMRLAVREKASRIRPVGRAVTAPTLDQGDEGAGEPDDEAAAVASGSPAGAGVADPRPAMARLASAGPPVRASSIIPSNRPRMETPRRAASASTQARRSWSRRMPTTVDLEVAMAPLTVIRAVYISGAEWWQPGGGHRGGDRFRIGSGPHRQRTEATARHLPRPGSLSDVQTSSCPWTLERIRTPGGVRRRRNGRSPLTPAPMWARTLGVQHEAGAAHLHPRSRRRFSEMSTWNTPVRGRNVPDHRGVNAACWVLTKVTDRCAPLRRALAAGHNH